MTMFTSYWKMGQQVRNMVNEDKEKDEWMEEHAIPVKSDSNIKEVEAPDWFKELYGDTVKLFEREFLEIPECGQATVVFQEEEPRLIQTKSGKTAPEINVLHNGVEKILRIWRKDLAYQIAKTQVQYGTLLGLEVTITAPCEKTNRRFYRVIPQGFVDDLDIKEEG